jgi:peptide/nickel transport system permease protein
LIAVFISVSIGTCYGAISGYFGGIIDEVLMRFVDIMLSFPSIFLILSVQAMLKPNIFNVMVVIGLTSWMGVARLVRGQFLSLKERLFVEAERALGAADVEIIFRHILPQALTPVIVAATMGLGGAILTESALSFLGLGVQPPDASWGSMLQNALDYLIQTPWLAIFPGLFIFLTVMAFNYLGETMRVWLNPKEDLVR